MARGRLVVLGMLAWVVPATQAQFTIAWYTIDSGGGSSAGGTFSLIGTIGQPDAGTAAGGTFRCLGGFWNSTLFSPACYANCDASSSAPVLNVNDFACFLNKFAAADTYANCDGSTASPTLNVNDFACFLNKFAAGCS